MGVLSAPLCSPYHFCARQPDCRQQTFLPEGPCSLLKGFPITNSIQRGGSFRSSNFLPSRDLIVLSNRMTWMSSHRLHLDSPQPQWFSKQSPKTGSMSTSGLRTFQERSFWGRDPRSDRNGDSELKCSPLFQQALSPSLLRAQAWEPLVSLIVWEYLCTFPDSSCLQSVVDPVGPWIPLWDGKVGPGAPRSAEGKQGDMWAERTLLVYLQVTFTLTASGRRLLVLTHLYISLPHATTVPDLERQHYRQEI